MKDITQSQLGSPTAYGTHELKSDTAAYKLEEVEKTFVYVELL